MTISGRLHLAGLARRRSCGEKHGSTAAHSHIALALIGQRNIVDSMHGATRVVTVCFSEHLALNFSRAAQKDLRSRVSEFN
jgi:hypothetical protein